MVKWRPKKGLVGNFISQQSINLGWLIVGVTLIASTTTWRYCLSSSSLRKCTTIGISVYLLTSF